MMIETKAHQVKAANKQVPLAYRAAAVRHLVRHSQSGGMPDWSDADKPL